MRIGIYGGTFDPPHIGHEAAAKAAANALELDKLIMIPAAVPPHKEMEALSCTGDQRLDMTRIAAEETGVAEVSDMELLRGGTSYTVDTVAAIREQYPDDELFLLMGTDMFLSIEKWKNFVKILRMTGIAVLSREQGNGVKLFDFMQKVCSKYAADVRLLPNDVVEASSSEVRQLLPERGGCEKLSDGVYSYIVKNRCYGAKPDLSWLRKKAYAMLKESRVDHVKGCEEEAARLAERWGQDVDAAREAGILHDITKKEQLDAQLLLCEKYGIILDNIERNDVKLLHAKTGAAIAREEFGMSEDVCSAILWHTTGRTGMTELEKIIYLADYIEPTRVFDGVEDLRKLAYSDIDAAVAMGLRMSLEDLRSRGITPHENTSAALQYLENKGF